MAKSAQGSQWTGYAGTVTMLVLALLFPVGLMIFNPTLMFERGWEQYVGTGIYFWAVLTLEPRARAALAQRAGVRGRAGLAQTGERRHGPRQARATDLCRRVSFPTTMLAFSRCESASWSAISRRAAALR